MAGRQFDLRKRDADEGDEKRRTEVALKLTRTEKGVGVVGTEGQRLYLAG